MSNLIFQPLSPQNWQDFETLFGPKGACAGCWCMWFRLKRSDWEKWKGERNKKAMQDIVNSGTVPGILGYENERAVAWCSIGRREEFPVLARSRILKPIDDQPVWSLVCLFLDKSVRRKGLAAHVVAGAAKHAKSHGGKIIEAYPIDTPKDNYPPAFAATGFYPTFKRAGFVECERRSATRPIMRYFVS